MSSPTRCPDFNEQPSLEELRPPARLVEWDDSSGLTLREAFESANDDTDPASCFPIGESIDTAQAMMFVVKGAAEVSIVRKLLFALGFVTPGKGVCEAPEPEVRAAGYHDSACQSFAGGECDCAQRPPVSESSVTGEIGGA